MPGRFILRVFLCVLFVSFVSFPLLAQAQQEPPLPQLIQNLANEGAQVRYLGRHNGLDGWVTIKQGQEQYFYMPQGGQSLLMGVLFDMDGKMVTARQVRALQEQSGAALDVFTAQAQPAPKASPAFKTPAEQMFDDIGNANWIALGKPEAPVLYAFIDTQCPHCHDFINDLRGGGYLENGMVQLRLIPVGLRPQTKTQAAVLLAAPDPQARLFAHLDGDDKALPLPPESINEQGVERNMAVMQSWKLDATPLVVYRAADGQVKIVQGRPKDIARVISDLPQ